ncbi:hypothetical protein AB0F88_23560 [Streptosporangium sp. NPDC023963]|uniref:hypothetical protein n=1 Tax=Streptosporangium sp. NPDC023963 TaxID=3155608 RepID=UPI00343E26A3
MALNTLATDRTTDRTHAGLSGPEGAAAVLVNLEASRFPYARPVFHHLIAPSPPGQTGNCQTDFAETTSMLHRRRPEKSDIRQVESISSSQEIQQKERNENSRLTIAAGLLLTATVAGGMRRHGPTGEWNSGI